jgi:hypothetical protein
VFIRKPETFFALEQLREQAITGFVERIQRAYRRYVSRRHFVVLRREAVGLLGKKKERRAESISRPFDGDYIQEPADRAAALELIREFGDRKRGERLVFSDYVEKLLPSPPASKRPNPSGLDLVPRVLLVTSAAIYLAEKEGWSAAASGGAAPERRLHPRTRIPLAALEGLALSKLADNFLLLRVPPLAALMREPDQAGWVPDKEAVACPGCAKPFGLFLRRHHCRACGRVFCDKCSQVNAPVPLRGHYAPVRVCDGCVGNYETELPEDVLLHASRKTEVVAVLRDLWGKARGGAELPVAYVDKMAPRSSPALSQTLPPGAEVTFVRAGDRAPEVTQRLEAPGRVLVKVPAGVPEDLVEARRAAEEKRRRRAERRREKEAALRKEQDAARAEQRELDRRQRIEEKKARKKAEREASRGAGADGGAAAGVGGKAAGLAKFRAPIKKA